MNLRGLFKREQTAPVARDRLQVLLAHERSMAGGSDLVAVLREEVLSVIKKHIPVDPQSVQVRMERDGVVSVLEIEVEVPTNAKLQSASHKAEAHNGEQPDAAA